MLDNKIGGGFSNSIFHNHLSVQSFFSLKKIISIIFHFFYYLISDKKITFSFKHDGHITYYMVEQFTMCQEEARRAGHVLLTTYFPL